MWLQLGFWSQRRFVLSFILLKRENIATEIRGSQNIYLVIEYEIQIKTHKIIIWYFVCLTLPLIYLLGINVHHIIFKFIEAKIYLQLYFILQY